MSFWFWNGLRKGIQTARYPQAAESAPGVTPGRPIPTTYNSGNDAISAAANCPVGAITALRETAFVALDKCIHCQRCHFGTLYPLRWYDDYEWAQLPATKESNEPLPGAFAKSVHIIVVDAGDCGACLNEVKQLNNPFYNLHRLGMFFTATPRTADILLIVGPVSENMRGPLLKTYEAMPDPKRVLAVGSCAITGNIFGRSFASAGGAGAVLPIDLQIPGNPPPPLAILHGLLVLTGRKAPLPQHVLPEKALAPGGSH